MSDRWHRCPRCGAVVFTADVDSPWGPPGWHRLLDIPDLGGAFVIHSHRAPLEGQGVTFGTQAEPLADLPPELVLS